MPVGLRLGCSAISRGNLKKIRDIGKYRLRARAGWYSVLIGESNVAIDPAIGGYGVADIYLGEFSPHSL